ncbi:hypothetical protein MX081_10900 [Streptococcus uberis]|uniref:hypothetical protein n=1 Tax=Streptococcus uberis TaxID=1349 RepID=UPI0027DE6E57|nr:hypothetical protein [Streptococcus uberis]MCK1254503.1 hypothetical protein [Streptococcus uberis]
MADKIDDSRYLWKARSEDGHFKIGLNDDARVEFGETFFSNVLHQRKLDLLKEQKKGFLQKNVCLGSIIR